MRSRKHGTILRRSFDAWLLHQPVGEVIHEDHYFMRRNRSLIRLKIKSLQISKRGKEILRGVDLDIGSRPIVVLGPNGAGKSTLFRTIVGLERPDTGTLTIDGQLVSSKVGRMRQREAIGYLSQVPDESANFTGLTAIEYAGWLKGLSGEQLKTAVTKAVSLSRSDEFAERKTAKLSGGQLKRIGIAQAIVHSPALVILDEPTAALDPLERIATLKMLSELAATSCVVFSTHMISDLLDFEGDVVVLADGKVLFVGGIDEFLLRGDSQGSERLKALESAYANLVRIP
jgi:ABC-2 type transport system ATP-binding protein